MHPILQEDLQDLQNLLQNAKEFGTTYLNELDQVPTSKSNVNVSLPPLPQDGLGTRKTQDLFKEKFYENIVSSSGSRYWGFVTGGTTPASIVGDWLTTVFDQNTQSTVGNGDVSAVLELHTTRLLLDLFGLPDAFIGAMVSGATMSNFTGLAVARQWLGNQLHHDVAREGILPGMKIYAPTPHSSAIKSLSMLGMGSNNIVIVPTLPERECMDIDALVSFIDKDPSSPFILIGSAGTVNTVDYDDLSAIAVLKSKYNFWWHLDAAFGAFAALSGHHRHLLNGWELADSITIDCHKWLNVPYDSAVILTRKEHSEFQVQTFQNSNAPYLGDPMRNFSYLNFVPENSRRFRALPVWFTLMAYGKSGYAELVNKNITLAKLLGGRINNLEGFELAAPVRLNTVCFTITSPNKENKIQQILNSLRKEGKLFITPTQYKGTFCLRAALVNWRTTEKDIDIAIEQLEKAIKEN